MGRYARHHRRSNHHRYQRPANHEVIHLTLPERPTDHEAFPEEGLFGVDHNGCLTELIRISEMDILIHYDDVPECDLTTVDGIPTTTALRTIIDLALDLDDRQLERIIDDALGRRLFTLAEAWDRLAEPDMAHRAGAEVLRQALPPLD